MSPRSFIVIACAALIGAACSTASPIESDARAVDARAIDAAAPDAPANPVLTVVKAGPAMGTVTSAP